jgi:cysteinyl-tRNA synthetase
VSGTLDGLMTKYKTSTGTVFVHNWGYQLQGPGGDPLNTNTLASATHDLLVIDASHDGTNARLFTPDELTRIKDGMGGRSVVVSYLSIGEADDYRDYWDKDWTTNGKASGRLTDEAPDWLGPTNPDWPESRKVRYWDNDWQDIVYNTQKTGTLDAVVKSGFDAAYLDIIDAYYFWGAEVSPNQQRTGDPKNEQQAARRMVDFVVEMTDHARETNPDFFVIPQNGAWILEDLGNDSVRKAAYLDAIGGIGVEDLYFRGGKDENNALRPDRQTINVLKHDFLDKGIPVYVVDYVSDKNKVAEFNRLALKDGFIPFAAPHRDLDRLVGTYEGDPAYIRPTSHADRLRGSMLADHIDALGGNDRLNGRGGNDRLDGGSGKDVLTGGAGRDQFVFDSRLGKANIDTISDFETGNDRILLDHHVFTRLDKGALDISAFVIGAQAADATDRIIYDSDTGRLFYDADGSGAGKAMAFARLDAGLNLTDNDFHIV